MDAVKQYGNVAAVSEVPRSRGRWSGADLSRGGGSVPSSRTLGPRWRTGGPRARPPRVRLKWPPLSRPFFDRNKLRIGGSDLRYRGGAGGPVLLGVPKML